MIDYTVSDIKDLRKKVDGEFHIWFQDCVRIADEIKADIPAQCSETCRKTSTSS